MSANAIIKTFEIFKDRLSRFLSGGETCAIHTLPFEGAEKAFHGCIVVTISRSTHAHHDASLSQLVLISMTGVGTPLVGVQEHPLWRITTQEGHVKRPAHQFLIVVFSHGPAHDQARKEIQDDGHVEPSFAGPEKGGIADPLRIGS